MELTGKITMIAPTNKVSDKFQKRELVIEYAENPQYPEYIKLEFIQDKCDLLNTYDVGQEVNVAFNLRGRAWVDPKTNTTKYFNTLQAWKINKIEKKVEEPQADFLDQNDDLPF